MNFVRGTLAALAFSVPVSAVAADLPRAMPVKAPVMAPVVYNWTGFYIGGNGGYSWGDADMSLAGTLSTVVNTSVFRTASGPGAAGPITSVGPVVTGAPANGSANVDGFLAGGQAGYNWQIDRMWVVGLETDLQWTNERGRVDFCFNPACTVGNGYEHKLKWFGTFRARAGVLVDPRVLLYATGGLAYGQIDTDTTATLFGVNGVGSSSTTRLGWTVGAGVEGAIDNNWSIKAEYLYVDYGKISNAAGALVSSSTVIIPDTPQTAFSTIVNTVTTASGSSDTRFVDHVFRAGINYRFTSGPVVARY